jgi:dimeric dUTPase (all-alpha-NTP-PPase superfamily)
MSDMLEEIFKMQREFANMLDQSRLPKDKQERVSLLCTAIIHEAVELQRLCNYKWWKKPIPFDEAKAKEELIDILHFVIHCAIELDMDANELFKEYVKKNTINKERQLKGY